MSILPQGKEILFFFLRKTGDHKAKGKCALIKTFQKFFSDLSCLFMFNSPEKQANATP